MKIAGEITIKGGRENDCKMKWDNSKISKGIAIEIPIELVREIAVEIIK